MANLLSLSYTQKSNLRRLLLWVVEIDTHCSEPRVNLGGGPLHVIIRLYSVLKTCDSHRRAIGDHTVQEET